MFREITIKPSKNLQFDLGQIAESLLFYEKVNLISSPLFFKMLIEHEEVDSFLELMTSGKINVKLEDNIFSTMRNEIAGQKSLWMRPTLVTGGKDLTIQDRLERVIMTSTDRKGYSRRLTKKILDNSEVILHSPEIIKFVEQDLSDQTYLKRAISKSVKFFDPLIKINPEEIDAKVHNLQGGFIIDTNVNFDEINKNIDTEKHFGVEYILFNIMNTRVDSALASQLDSDLVTSPIINSLLKEKINKIIHSSSNNLTQIDNFSDVFLHEGKRIRDALNSGERSLTEYMKILEKADKFKDWLKNIEDDKNILTEYNKAVASETWVEKLPAKSFRFTFFTGVGLVVDMLGGGGIGTAAGVAISAGDTFLLDKLIGGWKPNTFVNNEIEDFLKKK